MVLGAQAPREVAENELKLSLSMGEDNARNSIGKWRILVVLGAQAPREVAENELKLSLSTGEENARNAKGKSKILVILGLRHRADSQKMNLS